MEKTGIIYVLHGRKNQISQANVTTIKSLFPQFQQLQRIAFLEGSAFSLELVIDELVAAGAGQLIFVPILLFPATHAQMDLPQRIAAKLSDTQICWQQLETLGTTAAVTEFIIQQLAVAVPKQPILLVAHGTTHFAEPQQQLEQIAAAVSRRSGLPVLTGNHLGEPHYSEVAAAHPQALTVQRIFLSEGYLAKKISSWFIENRGSQDVILPTLEDSPYLKAAILERLQGVVTASREQPSGD